MLGASAPPLAIEYYRVTMSPAHHDIGLNQASQQSYGKPPIQEQGRQGKQKPEAAAGDQHPAPQTPLVVPVAPTSPLQGAATHQSEGGGKEREQGWWERLWTDPVATFTAALAIFTLVLAGIAI